MTSPFVIVIAVPTGVGKTTLSKMLCKYRHCTYLSEDEITKEIFPDVYKNIEDYPDKLIMAQIQLLMRSKEIFDSGGCVVIDCIKLSKEFIEEMKKAFHGHLIFKVLWPPKETTMDRDKRREGWTSGEIAIKKFYKKYEELKPLIGDENYMDNSHQTPEETLEKIIPSIELNKK